jgi:hypothetical protein
MDCSEAGTMLDELALGVLPGDQRTALFQHVDECPACRRLLDELSESADALLLAAPVATPAAGFEDRVLERVAAAREAGGGLHAGASGSGRAPAVRRSARIRTFAAAAAVVALLAVGGVAGARLGGNGDNGHEFQTVQLISATGADIGDVSTYAGPPAWFFMRLEGNLRNGTYQCVLDTDDGRTVGIGSLWAHDGHGAWGEHVRVAPRHVKAARLVDSDGTTVASARIN